MSKDYYSILGVEKNASEDEIRKSFKKLSLKYHPDRNPNGIDGLSAEECEEKYKSIVEAHSVLTDPDKKREYDNPNHFSRGSNFPGGNIFNMFNNLFNNFNFDGSKSQSRPQRIFNVITNLEDVYKGFQTTKKIKIEKDCTTCSSTGKSKLIVCNQCNGSGFKTIITRIGPMMTQQMSICDKCGQKGKIGSGDDCENCKGSGKIEKILEISISFSAGYKEDETYKVVMEDIEFIFVAKIECHSVFSRQGNNLSVIKEIDLKESLTGFIFPLNLLDGREIKVSSGKNIIKPNVKYYLKNLGISGGDIIFNFNIRFPDNLDDFLKEELKNKIFLDDEEIYYLQKN
jgi:DnaJ-class molecular chaperone